MGCAEMLVVGMIDLIAADLDVSVPAAGALVTANALGLAIGGPLLTFLTTRFDRRHVDHRDDGVRRGQPASGDGRRLPGASHRPSRDRRGAGPVHRRRDGDGDGDRAPERTGRAMAVIISGFATASALGSAGTPSARRWAGRGAFVVVVVAGFVVLVLAAMTLLPVPTPRDSGAVA